MRFHVLTLFVLTALAGCAVGAPTPYQQYKESQRTDCQLTCEKAHTEKDADGRRRCVQICEAKKELEEETENDK